MYKKNSIWGMMLTLWMVTISAAISQPIPSATIDSVAEKARDVFEVPGIAVAVIYDGKVIHSRGYGVRSLRSGEPVTEHTRFGIASNSKAFTTATLGILVDEGKLDWDDRVIDYIPEFRLYDPYVTEDFRIRDLLCHRSGMGLGAGDLMFFPDSTNFTVADIIHNLRYLPQRSPFRSKYDYDNLLYMVAGEIVARVSGKSWEEFVEERIMEPLGMSRSAASFDRLKDRSDIIDAHAPVEGKVQVIQRHRSMPGENPVGGIYSSIHDLSKWVIARLNEGKYGDRLQDSLFSVAVHRETWQPQTLLPSRPDSIYHNHFRAYGLGWFLRDVLGHLAVSHTGGLEGMVTQVTLLPELKAAVIVLTNQQSGEAFRSITNTVLDHFLGAKKRDWVNIYRERREKRKAKAEEIVSAIWEQINQKMAAGSSVNLEDYSGVFRDPWLGRVVISREGEQLFFRSERSPQLNGPMFHYNANTFVVKWTKRSFDADAFVMFNLDREGKAAQITMKAISPLTDFSYDFHDLHFVRVGE